MTLEDNLEGWKKLARDARVPGVAIAVLEGTKPIWIAGFGMANATLPITSDTIFEAASLSKQVVAFAALKLCKSGLLELDAPLTKYVLETNLELDPRLADITARHVLSHTSGLPNWSPEGEIPVTQFQPGEKFLYSGIGFGKLQTVIEKITNTSLEKHLQESIFRPFGMQNSSFLWQSNMESRAACGHDQNGVALPKTQALTEVRAAFSLHSTVNDLATFLTEFLKSELSFEMLQPQVQINEEILWGLGWGLEQCTSRQFFWQWGNNPGFRAFMLGARDTGFGVVVLTNGANGDRLWKPMLEDLTDEIHPALAWLEEN
jgi:CubicO group peptidase (beta-lactamase class C family)